MEAWTPLETMLWTMLACALSSAAVVVYSDKPLCGWTGARVIVGSMMYHAAVGAVCGAVGFEIFGPKKPWLVLGSAISVGVGILHISYLKKALLRLLGVQENE